MLSAVSAFIGALPLLTLVIERVAMRTGIAPWYAFFELYPPLLLAWLWIALRLPGEAWIETVAYFLLCAVGLQLAAGISTQQTLTALGAFYILPMIGVFNRNWGMVALSVALGIGFDVVELLLPSPLHGQLGSSAGAVAYVYGLLYLIFGGLNALVAHVLHQREKTLEAERSHARAQERRFRVLADNSADLIALHESDGRISYASPAWEALLGYGPETVEGQTLLDFCHPEDMPPLELSLRAASAGRPSRVVHRMRTSQGREVWCETLIRTVPEVKERGQQLQSTSRDVTERKAFEEQLARQADTDPLTELPNRAFLLKRTDSALRAGRPLAVIFIDLDNFKNINDSLGHAAGDRVLIAFAQRVSRMLPPGVMLARLGGDEFAVLMDGADAPEGASPASSAHAASLIDSEATGAATMATGAAEVVPPLQPAAAAPAADTIATEAEVLADRIAAVLRAPFDLGERHLYLTTSAGIVEGEPRHTSADDLMRDADAAMYAAKRSGKAGHRRFDHRMVELAETRLRVDSDLRLALSRGEFVLFYQPIVNLGTQRPAGFEALIRWQHPTLGLLSPDRFIPIAEENGLIVPIDHWVLGEACRQACAWAVLHPADPPIFVSVNLSAQQFRSPGLADAVRDVLQTTGVKPFMLRLEITESALLVRQEESLRAFAELRQLGVRMVIDDFGTGYANLSYLQKFRVDALKIDRSFIARLAVDPEETAIVRSLLSLAKELKMDVTGEGIETPQQCEHLLNQDCTYGQGYLFSRPVPAAEATAYLAGWLSRA